MKAALLLFATAISTVSASLSWEIDGPCSISAIVNVQCDGSSTCNLGDTAIATGSVTASDEFDNDVVIFQACVGIGNASWCPQKARKVAGKLCDFLTPASGQSCGEVGDYTMYHTEKIPNNEDLPESVSSFVKQFVTLHLIIGDGVHDDDCSIRSGYFTMAYSMMGLASLALAGAAYAAKRRVDAGATDDEASSSFVEMKDVALV